MRTDRAKQRSIAVILVALQASAVFGAIHHTKAQQAYFEQHAKCAQALREAKKKAAVELREQAKTHLESAREEYRRCEAYSHLVWKYFPSSPPQPPP